MTGKTSIYKPSNKQAFKLLAKLVKELGLAYYLGPKLTKRQITVLQEEIAQIFIG